MDHYEPTERDYRDLYQIPSSWTITDYGLNGVNCITDDDLCYHFVPSVWFTTPLNRQSFIADVSSRQLSLLVTLE